MLSGSPKEWKIIVACALTFALAGEMARVIALSAALVPANLHLSFESYRILLNVYKALNLLSLVPVFTCISGGFVGYKLFHLYERNRHLISNYEVIQNRIVDFINQIERGNLDYKYVPANGEKILSNSLESMRISIKSTSRKEFERSEINRISSDMGLMLQSPKNIECLCEETISFLVDRLEGAVQGAFYIVEQNSKGEGIIQLKSSYAYDRKRYLKGEFKFGQGLVGQAVLEQEPIIRTEIPEDYPTIKSGLLGHLKPKSIFINPLMVDDQVVGVIELASFRKFTALDCAIIEEVSKTIARAVQNVKVNLITYDLLKKSEKMGDELILQKKKLIQNADDLVKTQAELKRSNIKLEEQIKEVHNTNKRSQILLENANEVITIYSQERKIRYVSPSIKTIMGYYPEEIVGKEGTENVHPLDTEKFGQLFDQMRSFPENEHSIQYRYFKKGGDVLWMEAKGKNLLMDEVIKGYIINSRDISEQRTAAKEQRIRAKMQALSENSSDLIIRIDIFSRCTYINPVIEKYTNTVKSSYIDKPLAATELDNNVIETLKILLKEVSISKKNISIEMMFPTVEGNKIMNVNAIPEFNDIGEPESVLFACHDITEAKAREELIQKKQKSISDSINYALNIQSALMPNEKDLRKILPNSFMLYKPKDVVSGDYPWLLKKGDFVFVGAMDCTGHGVPGALMSIIGFFLQDIIIQKSDNLNAGEVLNKLHLNVVERLKQTDPECRINDGMDAAVCRINLKTRVLDYCGAHRPLYHVSCGSMSIIKGDKFPVGSTQYRNRKEFVNNSIQLKSGDSLFFMTDGYPDQFGGPSGKQKFGSDAVERLIRENMHLSIFQIGNVFRKAHEDWKGNCKQMDDVLVIGIKI